MSYAFQHSLAYLLSSAYLSTVPKTLLKCINLHKKWTKHYSTKNFLSNQKKTANNIG